MEIGTFQLVQKLCVLESNGLKVTIETHDINVTLNNDAKELINKDDQETLIRRLKLSVDNKAKTIIIRDVKQFEAYHQLYLKEKLVEEEKENQRKNESKNKQLDF